MPRNAANITLQQLAATPAGKLPSNAHLFKQGKATAKTAGDKPGDAEKAWIEAQLQYWANKHLLTFNREYRFAQPRRFKFDWAITNEVLKLKIAVEYEGLMSDKSGHTTVTGYTKDTEKYRLASELGWHLVRVTVLNYKNIIQELNNYMERREY